MRKLSLLSMVAVLVAAGGYAAKRFLGAREAEWQTVGSAPSPAASPSGETSLAPEPIDQVEPADLYDVEPGGYPEPSDDDRQ